VACREKLRLVGIAGSRCLSTVVVTAVAVAWRRADSHIWRMDRRKNDRRRNRRAWPPTATPTHASPKAIEEVSADRIRQTIEKLVSFGNRSTISAQDEDSIKAGKGIGAAREWIKAEFERYSKECGGCWR